MYKLISITALGFYCIAVFGILIHAVKKWANNEMAISPFAYLFQVNVRASTWMLIATIGGVITALATGTIADFKDPAHITAAFLYGFACDSTVNTDKQP